MKFRLTILCENSVGKPGRAVGEHGFACLVETPTRTLLFDTGQGLGLQVNSRELELDLAAVDGIVLSHGHYDHGDGLPAALALTGPSPIYTHPDLFVPRFWRSPFELRAIGLTPTQSELETQGADFDFDREFRQLAPGVWLSGEVPRVNAFETGDPHLVIRDDDAYRPDPLHDDQSLILDGREGLILLLGCAHAGIANIMHHALQKTGRNRIHAIIGGTHLGPAGDAQFSASLKALRAHGVERLAVGHCTGLGRSAQLVAEFGGRCSFAAVGSTFEFPAATC